MSEALQPNPTVSVELPPDYDSRDLELVSGRPTARQMRHAVARVQLLRLAMRGMNAKEAAKALGVPEHLALVHYRDPDFQADVMRRISGALGTADANFKGKVKTLHERIEEQAEASFADLVAMLENEKLPLHLRARINQDFLDRCAETQKESTLNHKGFVVDAQQLVIASQVAMELDMRRQTPPPTEGRPRDPQLPLPPNVIPIEGRQA